jgi:YVTN family beta-propeller protein
MVGWLRRRTLAATGTVTAVGLRDASLGVVFTLDGTHVYMTNEHSLTVIDTTTTDAYASLPATCQEVCSSVPTESTPTAPISATARSR